MTGSRFLVSDLVGRPGERRVVTGEVPLDLMVGEATATGPARVRATLEGIDRGVMARFDVAFTAHLTCTRCLTEWDEEITVSASQVFEPEPDDDGYALGRDDTVDLAGPVRDEAALAIPVRPLCRQDCLGLCPTCGTDLNRSPCGGHVETSESPFDALKGMFEQASEAGASNRDLSQS